MFSCTQLKVRARDRAPLSLIYPQLERAPRDGRGSFEFAADACTRNLCFSDWVAVPYNVYRA